MMLQTNQTAPHFSSLNQNDKTIRSTDFIGKNNVVLYFYPKDDTPGCTIEANDFTSLASDFSDNNTVVIGVSKDGCDSHRAFIEKYKLQIELLADTSGEVCDAYGVWQEKERNGVKKMGIVRSTFVIDKNGVLVEAQYFVDPNGHAQTILDIVKNL